MTAQLYLPPQHPEPHLPPVVLDAGRPACRREVAHCRRFAFFAQPDNHASIIPPSPRFRFQASGQPTMEKGRVIGYTTRVTGLPSRWRTLIGGDPATSVTAPHPLTISEENTA